MKHHVHLSLLALLLANALHAQPVNPLGAAPADPLVGTFSSEKFTLTLNADGAKKYSGGIQMAGQQFPASATSDGKSLTGSFTAANGKSFDFTASLEANTLTFTTGGATHTLQRRAGAPNPVPAPGPVGNVPAATFDVIRSTPTGQSLFAAYPNAKSAKAVLTQTVSDLSAYFRTKPAVAGAFADVKDLRAGASFTVKPGQQSLKGMIFVGIGERGGAVTVVFDAADAPRKNLANLASSLPAETRWEIAQLPDGSGTMKLPVGWRITSAAKGAVDVVGPEGQSVDLGLAYPVNTPQAEQAWLAQQAQIGMQPKPSNLPVAPFPADPVKALESMTPAFSRFSEAYGGPPFQLEKIIEAAPIQGAPNSGFIHATFIRGKGQQAVRIHSVGLVAAAATAPGQWLYYTSYVTAPEESFANSLPVMLQIWASWKVSDAVLQGRLKQAMNDLKATGEIYKQSSQKAAKVRENANADFDEVIRGYRTVEDTQTGERREADLGNVDKIVEKMNEKEGYARYKEIPLRDQ